MRARHLALAMLLVPFTIAACGDHSWFGDDDEAHRNHDHDRWCDDDYSGAHRS